jgi:uncharacterized repeat protein (TIGR01451 family)
MNKFARLRHVLLVAVALIFAGWRADGQGITYSVTSSASTLLVSNTLTFTITVTNISDVPIGNLVITDALPASVLIASASDDFPEIIFTNIGSVATFTLATLSPNNIFQVALLTEPTAAGLITNTVNISTDSAFITPGTNLVVNVTNTVIIANLGVILSAPAQPVIVNDLVAYEITVTNAGPDAAPQVDLVSALPAGAILEGISPTNQTYTNFPNSILGFQLGTIATGSSSSLLITVEPTNSGVLAYDALVGSPSVTNTSSLDTFAITNLTVLPIQTGVLTAVTNSGQSIDFQNGLEEQSILLSNISATNVAAARVNVSGLNKQLYNAVGTNSGNPYVTFAAPLATGQSVSLLLQYNPRGTFPFTNGQLQAYPVPLPNLTPPVTTSTSTNINISGIFKLPDGNMLLQFPATTGLTYTIVYSDNVRFSNAMIAPPAIAAPANILQWIDYGPPTTVSATTNTSARFYRVLQNP